MEMIFLAGLVAPFMYRFGTRNLRIFIGSGPRFHRQMLSTTMNHSSTTPDAKFVVNKMF